MNFLAKLKKRKKIYGVLSKLYYWTRERQCLYKCLLKLWAWINPQKELRQYSLMGVREYCDIISKVVSIVEQSQEREVLVPAYYKLSPEKRVPCVSPSVYTVDLANVGIIGSNSFLLKDNNCLYDMYSVDYLDRYDLRFESLKSIDKEGRAAILYTNTNEIIDEGILLIGFGSFNYFHLTVELMSKLYHIDRDPKNKITPLIVDEIVLNVSQYRKLLDVMNIHHRPIIALKRRYKYEVKKLTYVSDCSWMPINIKNSCSLICDDFLLSADSIRYVRETVMRNLGIVGSNTKKRVFVSRKSQHNSRIVNENEIIHLFVQYGFQVIYPETLSLTEQVEIFSEAEYIASSSGAALTNLIYCSKRTTLICISPKQHSFSLYSTIGNMFGLSLIFLNADIAARGSKTSGDQLIVDVDYCAELLNELFNNESGE